MKWCAWNRSKYVAAKNNIKTFDMRDVMGCLVDDIIDSKSHKIVSTVGYAISDFYTLLFSFQCALYVY